MPGEIANLLNYRFSTLGEFIGLQQTNNIPPKTAQERSIPPKEAVSSSDI